MTTPHSDTRARRWELTGLLVSCSRDDYAFCNCPSPVNPLGEPCKAWAKLAACDAKIAKIEEELVRLHRDRILWKAYVNDSHDTLLGRIPVEVVTQIFGFCVQLPSKDSSAQKTLLALAGVSKAWRNLVVNTPQLWTTIAVHIDHGMGSVRMSRIESVQTWLRRSARTPLSISLHFNDMKGVNPFLADSIVGIVAARADRWKHLSLSLGEKNDCETVVKFQTPPNLRQLESLKIKLDNSEVGPSLKSFLQPLSDAHLKYFKITRLHSLSDIHIIWNTLTCLKIGVIPRTLVLRALSLAPALIQCKIGMIHDKDDRPQTNIPSLSIIPHSNLQCLHIEHFGGPSSQEIHFDMLVLPSLKDFSYRAHNCVSSDVRALRSMITQSHCAIERLSLCIEDIPSALDIDVRKIVGTSPTMKHIVLDVTFALLNKEEPLLDRLAGSQLHPHLETLELTYSGSYKLAFARLADCFDPKWRPGHVAIMRHRPLRYARIKFSRESQQELFDIAVGDEHFLRLVEVKKSGFNLELLDCNGKDIIQGFENTRIEE